MLGSIHAALKQRFGRQSLSQRSPFGMPRRGIPSQPELCRAAAAVVESLESRRLLSAFIVNSLAEVTQGLDKFTLRRAVNAANANPGPDTITFDPALTARRADTITLTGELVLSDITGQTTITGPGAGRLTVDGNNVGRVFKINPGAVAEISGLSITGGTAGTVQATSVGGGIFNSGTLTLRSATVFGNSAIAGAGIGNAGTMSINDSGFFQNTIIGTDTVGGAIDNTGTLTVTQSTFTGNRANSGGAIRSLGSVTLNNCTITGNIASFGGGISIEAGSLSLTNTLVAANSPTAIVGPDISGEASGSNNLIGDGTGLTGIANGALGNKIGTTAAKIDPRLSPVTDNGGPTLTGALLAGSPAIDAGVGTALSPFDQRGPGFARVVGAAVDIGAFEFKTLAESLVVTTLDDENNTNSDPAYGAGTSLREALAFASNRVGADTITFAAALTAGGPATIRLALFNSLALAPLDSAMTTITGPGASLLTVSGNDNDLSSVLRVQENIFATLNGLTITGGNSDEDFGGGISNSGNLTVNNCIITGNKSFFGAGIGNEGTLTLVNCTISGNTAAGGTTSPSAGGGILFRTVPGLSSATILINCTVSGNTAVFGGGISGKGRLTIVNSTISGNTAGQGGGIQLEPSTGTPNDVIINNSTISGNSANGRGGVLAEGTVSLSNTLIAGNTADVAPDFQGIVSGNFNLIGDGTLTIGITNGTLGNRLGTTAALIDPKLGPLADNGGPTQTRALLPGSPAIDLGSTPGFATQPDTDQRGTGFVRVFGGRVDIGAFELGAPTVPPVVGGTPSLLTVTLAAVVPPTAVTGVKVKAKVTVSVTNPTAQIITGLSRVELFLSANGGLTSVVAVVKKLTFKPGKTVKVPLKVKMFPSVANGAYALVARVTDPGNEEAVTAPGGSVALAAPFVNLVGSMSPGTVGLPGKGIGTLLIQNLGNVPIKFAITTRLFASADKVAGAEDTGLGDVIQKLNLKPNSVKSFKLKFTVPVGLAAGLVNLIGNIDALAQVTESSKADNTAAAP